MLNNQRVHKMIINITPDLNGVLKKTPEIIETHHVSTVKYTYFSSINCSLPISISASDGLLKLGDFGVAKADPMGCSLGDFWWAHGTKVERSNENGSDKPVAIETSYLRGWLWLKKRGGARNSGSSFDYQLWTWTQQLDYTLFQDRAS